MALRATPEQYYETKLQTTQTPQSVQLPDFTLAIEPNTALVILGLVAIVGIIGLFAVALSDRKCR